MLVWCTYILDLLYFASTAADDASCQAEMNQYSQLVLIIAGLVRSGAMIGDMENGTRKG